MKKRVSEYNRIRNYIGGGRRTPEQALEWFRDFRELTRSDTRVNKTNLIEDLCRGMAIMERAYMNGERYVKPSKKDSDGEADQPCSCKEV